MIYHSANFYIDKAARVVFCKKKKKKKMIA